MNTTYVDLALSVDAINALRWDGFHVVAAKLARHRAELVGYCWHHDRPSWLLTTRLEVRGCPDLPRRDQQGSDLLSAGARGIPDAAALASDCGQRS